MAIEAADVALFTNDLRCLAALMALAKVVRRKVLENVAFSVITKVRATYTPLLGLNVILFRTSHCM